MHTFHPDFTDAEKLLYKPNGLIPNDLVEGKESQEYGALSFKMGGKSIEFRVAKITPTKVGQFVTLWKRIGKGPIVPYHIDDPIDLFVINTRYLDNFGQFIFSKEALIKHNILSTNMKEGKLGFRVYPPWDIAPNSTAKKTQIWQLPYFYSFNDNQLKMLSLFRV